MPGITLPTFTSKDIASRNTKASCYVTIGCYVYDMTTFLDDHPGGEDLILPYGGKDVGKIMDDEISHTHSEAAYEILRENLVGFTANESIPKVAAESQQADEIFPVPLSANGVQDIQDSTSTPERTIPEVHPTTGMSSAADLSRETDARADYEKHQFLDLSKPLLMQIWNGGFSKDFYLAQVHRPRHYPGGRSAPLFGNFLEPLSKTSWYVVPMVWLPPVIYGSVSAYQHLPSALQFVSYWLTGLGLWTLVEYGLHRGLFHVDKWVDLFMADEFRLILGPDICRTIGWVLRHTFSFTVFITTFQWTSCA